jgi:DNA-binding response OmpR family regulator
MDGYARADEHSQAFARKTTEMSGPGRLVPAPHAMLFIALLEREPALRAQLLAPLQSAGHHVVDMPYAAALTRHLAVNPCDIVVVSSHEADADHPATIAHLRAHRRLGIVVLVGTDRPEGRIAALAQGADVCVARPDDRHDPRELLAALDSLARRMRDLQDLAAPGQHLCTVKGSDAWQLFSREWLLLSPDGLRVQLTAAECSLVSLLLAHPGKPVSRRDIVTALGHDYRHYDERRLEALVSRLRRKLGKSPQRTPLRVAHGFGYAFTATGIVS